MRRSAGIPAPLEDVRLRFELWCRSRTGRTRIPEALWAAAVDLAREYGVHRTTKTLRLDCYRLKKRVAPQNTSAATDHSPMAGPAFLELPAPVSAAAGECVVELEDGYGAKMRIQLMGIQTPDVAALSRSFWDASDDSGDASDAHPGGGGAG